MTGPGVRLITETQALAIRVLHDRLDRTCPEVAHLTHAQAGDLIIALRAETRRSK